MMVTTSSFYRNTRLILTLTDNMSKIWVKRRYEAGKSCGNTGRNMSIVSLGIWTRSIQAIVRLHAVWRAVNAAKPTILRNAYYKEEFWTATWEGNAFLAFCHAVQPCPSVRPYNEHRNASDVGRRDWDVFQCRLVANDWSIDFHFTIEAYNQPLTDHLRSSLSV